MNASRGIRPGLSSFTAWAVLAVTATVLTIGCTPSRSLDEGDPEHGVIRKIAPGPRFDLSVGSGSAMPGEILERANPHRLKLLHTSPNGNQTVSEQITRLAPSELEALRDRVSTGLKNIELRRELGQNIGREEVDQLIALMLAYRVSPESLQGSREFVVDTLENRALLELGSKGDYELFRWMAAVANSSRPIPATSRLALYSRIRDLRKDPGLRTSLMLQLVSPSCAVASLQKECDVLYSEYKRFERKEIAAEIRSNVNQIQNDLRSTVRMEIPQTSIRDAAFPRFLIAQAMDRMWAPAYQSAFNENYQKVVGSPTDEDLMDFVMTGLATDALPKSDPDPGINEVLSSLQDIGSKRAKKVLRAKGEKCALSEEALHYLRDGFRPGKALVQLGVLIGSATACETRQVIYTILTEKLNGIRKNPDEWSKVWATVQGILRAKFEEKFPESFEMGFTNEMVKRIAEMPKLVATKFGGSVDELLWSQYAPLFESFATTPIAGRAQLRTSDIARGLNNDIAMANLLASARDPELRGISGALFYASVNRILYLIGGSQLTILDEEIPVLERSNRTGKRIDEAGLPPVLATQDFGGFTMGGDSGRGFRFGALDVMGYLSTPGLRLFPESFEVKDHEVPSQGGDPFMNESLTDVSTLVSGVVSFLGATRSGGQLGEFIGADGEEAKILDPTSKVLVPELGRKAGYGLLAAAIKNIMDPDHGHLEIKPTEGRFEFYEKISLGGRTAGDTRTTSVASLMLAIEDLYALTLVDQQIPEDAKKLIPVIKDAIHFGNVALGAQAQLANGAFAAKLGANGPNANTGAAALADHVLAMRALTRAYAMTRFPLLGIRLRHAWKYLATQWQPGLRPGATADEPIASWAQPGQDLAWARAHSDTMQQLSTLWLETQPIFKDLQEKAVDPEEKGALQYGRWEMEFMRLDAWLAEDLAGKAKAFVTDAAPN